MSARKKKLLTLFFHPGGKVVGIYDDAVAQLDLGPMKIERATEIEFNNVSKMWEVRDPNDRIMKAGIPIFFRLLFSHKLRSKCLEWEQKWLNDQLAKEAA